MTNKRCPSCKQILTVNRDGPGYWCRRCRATLTILQAKRTKE